MPRTLRAITLLALVALGNAALAADRLLSSDSVKSYEMALRDMRAGRTPRAAAVLKGLLLDRVRVGIDADSLDEKDAATMVSGVSAGVDVWARALPDSPFVFVGPESPADVVVRFVPRIDRRGQIQGLVRAERRFFFKGGHTGYELDGEILLRHNAFGKRLNSDEISRVAAHELGHLLGLDDRYESEGLMGAFTPGPGQMGPTPAELQAVLKFRADTRNVLQRIVAMQKAKKPSKKRTSP
ncbi:MAG: hypothetical protein ACO1SV_09875 [Fimbriimonas sp.]